MGIDISRSTDANSGPGGVDVNLGTFPDLEEILQHNYSRKNLRNYIASSWIPSQKEPNDFYKSESKNIAMNFMDFWLDANDFCAIPNSPFQSFRACFIFEKYLMHGASRQVLLTTNTIDDITESLFGGSVIPQEIDGHLYDTAMFEAVEFLGSEVFALYEQEAISLDTKKHTSDMVHAIRSLSRRRSSLFNSPDRDTINQIFQKVISDQTYYNAFRDYLKALTSENLLFAYSDLQDVEEKVSSMPESVSFDLKICTILHYVNSYYDRYLSLGAVHRVSISEATRGDCLRKLASLNGVEVSDNL
jgi:hypothetical protein